MSCDVVKSLKVSCDAFVNKMTTDTFLFSRGTGNTRNARILLNIYEQMPRGYCYSFQKALNFFCEITNESHTLYSNNASLHTLIRFYWHFTERKHKYNAVEG